MLEVTIYNLDGKPVAEFSGADDDFGDVDYVSLVNNETYGPPALVAPSRGDAPRAAVEDHVLYINTNLVPFFKIVRTSS